MKVNFSQPLLDITGDPITGPDGTIATLGGACINSLLNLVEGQNPDGKEKFRKYHLAVRIQDAQRSDPTIDLESGDISYLVDALAVGHTPLIYGQGADMLEGRPSKITKEPSEANSPSETDEE